ncbi:ankyrin repeat protein [Penguinpox virus 2]|nr:ankyrin repeat protein [Penguinpox virus 2]
MYTSAVFRSVLLDSEEDVLHSIKMFEQELLERRQLRERRWYNGDDNDYEYDEYDDNNEPDSLYIDDGIYLDLFRYTPLYLAIEARRPKLVEILLNQKICTDGYIDINRNYGPLHVLTLLPETRYIISNLNAQQYVSIVSKLISKAKKMKLCNSVSIPIIKEVLRGCTTLTNDELKELEKQVIEDELKIAKLLLSRGYNVNAEDEYRYTPLRNAVINGNLELTKLLMANGADTTRKYDGFTIFEIAALSPNINVVKEIIRTCGYDRHSNILCSASERGHTHVVKYLLDIGLKANVKDIKYFVTPLHRAVSKGYIEIIYMLISHGAVIDVKDNKGNTPLMHGLSYPDVVKLLLDKGANPNTINGNRSTPLHVAASTYSLNIVDILLSYDVVIDAKDNKGDTPLMNGLYRPDVVKLLLEKGANPNAVNNKGHTPLHFAVRYRLLDTIYLLLSYGIAIDVKDNKGNTPLMYGLSYPDVVKLLLEKGANPNVVNNKGHTPLKIAMSVCILSSRYLISHIILREYLLTKQQSVRNEGMMINANLMKNSASLKSIRISCENELERMKMLRINSKYSLIIFISTCNIKFLSRLVRNDVIHSIDLTSFKIYGSWLKKSIDDSTELRNKFETAMSIINFKLDDSTYWKMLPLELQSYILSLLDDSELSYINDHDKVHNTSSSDCITSE